jgi:predicted anti-sigma-YlaC factor YlaD
MIRERIHTSTNWTVAIGVLIVTLVGGTAGFDIPRLLIGLVALLGSFLAVSYIGWKGYEIVEESKQ